MLMDSKLFHELCVRHFAFLSNEYGCLVEFIDPPGPLPDKYKGWRVFFRNATTGISITYEFIEKLPSVHLHNLNAVPEEPKAIKLGILILTRAPELNPLKDEKGLPLKQSPEELLSRYAVALKAIGADILRGDFSTFPHLYEEARRRANLRRIDPDHSVYF